MRVSSTTVQRFAGMTLLPGGQLHPAIVSLRDGRIDDVTSLDSWHATRRTAASPGLVRLRMDEVLAPAFIDAHCHGAGGGAANDGGDGLAVMASALLSHGVGAFLATFMTAPLADLRTSVGEARRYASDAIEAGLDGGGRATLLGVHLEGPALSPARSAGHDQAALIDPAGLWVALADDPDGWRGVRLITMAPERPGGLEVIQRLVERGIEVSIGHTDASLETATAGYAAGARSTTHLFNGMPPLLHRAPGPVGAALASAPFIELIVDGIHVDQALLRPLARAIGPERLLLVSDALPLAGSRLRRVPVPGSYAIVRGAAAVHPDGTLAGGRLLLDELVESGVAAGIPLPDALRAASENPSRLLRLSDRGVVAVGAHADLVVVSRKGRLRRIITARR